MPETIAQWTPDRLSRHIKATQRSGPSQLPRSATHEQITATDKLTVADRLELSPQATSYLDDQLQVSSQISALQTRLTTDESNITTLTSQMTNKEDKANKGVANGYCQLDSGVLVPASVMGSGTANSTKYLRGDRTWTTFPTIPPTISTTVAGLGTGTDGQLAYLRCGSNAAEDLVPLVYDSSAGKWVSEVFATFNPYLSVTSFTSDNTYYQAGDYFSLPWKIFNTAGLTLQANMTAVSRTGGSGTVTLRLQANGYNDAAGVNVLSITGWASPSHNSGSDVGKSSGWSSKPSTTVYDYLNLWVEASCTNTPNFHVTSVSVQFRWTS